MLLAALVSLSLAHICLLYPDQRGGANITGPGSHNCYQPQGMCVCASLGLLLRSSSSSSSS